MIDVKWRTWGKGLPPKPIKLEIPGWAGDHKEHSNGCTPQPWHCVPFVEGSTYGLELIYPFDAETKVVTENDEVKFISAFTKEECIWSEEPTPPFSNFAPGHYGHTSCLDLIIPEDHVIRLEPHPRFFTDRTGTVPIVVPGHIQSWWSKIFFIVFKAPAEGQMHIFKKGEPYGQILIVPKKSQYNLTEMSAEDKIKRSNLDNNINKFKDQIAKNKWKDHKGNSFDDKYKQLASAFVKNGQDGITELIRSADCKVKNKQNVKVIGKFIKK